MIRPAGVEDAAQLCDIYNHYVLNTPITFEEQAMTVEDMRGRVSETTASLPWLVWEEENILLGYSHASKWKGRCAYRYSVESTVYLRPNKSGRGIGSALYRELLVQLKEQHFHTVIGGIALPNIASVALHEKLGFEKIAQFREVGKKFGQWIDVGYWQMLLDAYATGSNPPK
jgi:L-amino acid N-acyltransferase YncA